MCLDSAAMFAEAEWDSFWHFERFYREAEPLDFRRWKRDSQRALRSLYPDGRPLLLDSSAGMGDHTVNLAEEGFRVEACDRSPVALGLTREAVEAAGVDVRVFSADWRRLERPERYDLIFNDELHSIYEAEDLRDVLAGLYEALRPGGALVFFFADAAHPEAEHGLEALDWDWQRLQRAEVAWDCERGHRRVTLMKLGVRGPDYIDERHLFLARCGDAAPEVTDLTMRRVYRWDWHGIAPLLTELGYVDLRTDHFPNVKGYTFAMSRAFRPRR